MTVDTDSTLSARLKLGRERAVAEAEAAMTGLAEEAESLGMAETAGNLRRTQQELAADTFKIIVMGRFKNGKSTLLNALMGGTTHPVDLEGQQGPMVSNQLPCTARLTEVRYAEEPYVKAYRSDGSPEPWSLSRYLNESTLGVDEAESQVRLGDIMMFEMGYPAVLCEAGVKIFDSPGLDDVPARTAHTREATKRCDAAIVVYKSDALMGQSELEAAAMVIAEGTRVFTVINVMYDTPVTDELRSFIWNRYVKDHLGRGPAWNGHDLALHDIYFVNARQARDARYSGNTDGVHQSGLGSFEHRLGAYLLDERYQTHLQKFTTVAAQLSRTIDQQISQRKTAAVADREHLVEAFAAAQPKLAAIRARPGKLPRLFERYRAEAQIALTASFDQAVARIRQELPGHLEEANLPSGQKLVKVLHQKKIQAEAVAEVSAFVTKKIQDWSEKDVPVALAPILERLGDDVESEIAAIGRQFDEINFELTGWTNVPEEGGAIVGKAERILSAVAGLLLGDLSAALTGGAGGWRGAVGGIGGALGSAVLLIALGATATVVFLPVTLLAAAAIGTMSGGVGLEKRIKKAVVARSDEFIKEMPASLEPRILAELDEEFARIESAVTQEIIAAIAEEQRNIENIVELNQRDQAEREQDLAELTEIASRVVAHREHLERAILVARQS